MSRCRRLPFSCASSRLPRRPLAQPLMQIRCSLLLFESWPLDPRECCLKRKRRRRGEPGLVQPRHTLSIDRPQPFLFCSFFNPWSARRGVARSLAVADPLFCRLRPIYRIKKRFFRHARDHGGRDVPAEVSALTGDASAWRGWAARYRRRSRVGTLYGARFRWDLGLRGNSSGMLGSRIARILGEF